jgi:hypothetical protein
MELPGSLLIWNQLSVEGFFEGHPHVLPKIAPVLRELVKMMGPGGIRQPIAATYPIMEMYPRAARRQPLGSSAKGSGSGQGLV